MAEHDTNNIQAMLKFCPHFDGKDKAHFFNYKDKLCVVLSFHRQSVAAILQGDPKPPAAQNSTAVATWERANENLFSILFFTTERSANNVVKTHMGKTREDGVGNGQAAWSALEEKYNCHTKEARRAYHEKLHSTKMKSGDDPDDFLYTVDGFRERLEDMGQPVPDERYEDIILQAIPAEYERVRTASYERRDFHLADIRRMMSALYIDCFSRPNNSPLVAGRGVAMQVTGGDDSAIKCHYCGDPGHRQKICVAWIAAQCKNGNQQTTRSTPLGRLKKKAGGDGKPMWCSFHKSNTHSNETCRTLQQQLGNNGSANCANQGSDYPAVLTASDPPPRNNIEEQSISFSAVEVPTRDEPSKEESLWPFGSTGEAVASFDTSGFFSGFGGATSEETINSGAQAPGTRTHITGTPKTLARALIMAVMLHYAWLTLGSFLFNRVTLTNTSGQPETFGGITNAEDGLALAVVPAADKWNRGSNSLVSVMVDSGASGHYFDDALIPRLRYRLENYQELAIRRYITTAGGHQLEGAGQGLLRSHIIDAQRVQRLIQISMLIVPGLGRNLFSVKQASRNGVVSIFNKYNPRLEANNFTLPFQKLENDLCFFSLDLVSRSSAPELEMQAAATATLWHRRMRHLNRKSLDLLKQVNNNGVSFDGTVPDCDVCAVGKSRQRAHPKTADQHVQHPVQLVFTDLMGQFTPEALGGYKYVSKISDEHTRWTDIYLLKNKDGALHAFQSFVQSMVIPSGVRVERLRADEGKGPQLLMQELPPGDDPDRDNKGHNYITDDDFLRDLRSYTSVVDHPGSASTDHVTASRRSDNTLVAERLGRIGAITRRDLLEDGALPGEASPTGEVPQGGVLERPEQQTSPAGGPVEAPLAGSSSLQQHGQSRHGVTTAVTRAGNAARYLRERTANDSAHLAEITTDGTLSELRRLGLYTKALLPDVVHQTHKAESVVEYACATTNVQRYSVWEKMEVIPNTLKKPRPCRPRHTGRRPLTRRSQA